MATPVGDLLEHGGLASLGRRDDQAALSQPDGSEEVDHAGGDFAGGGLEHDLIFREDGGEVLEDRAVASVDSVSLEVVDLLHADEAEVALALLGGPDLSRDGVPGAQAEAADLRLGDVDVAVGAMRGDLTEEAVALVHDLEDAGGDEGLLGGGDLEEPSQQVVAVQVAQGVAIVEADAGRKAEQFLLGLGAKLHNVQSNPGSRHVHLYLFSTPRAFG